MTLVGGLARWQGRPRMTVASLRVAVDTHTSTALFPFAQANTYREQLSIKGLWGRAGWGLFKAKSVPTRGGGRRPTRGSCWAPQWWQGDPHGAGCHKRHFLRGTKPVTRRQRPVCTVQTFGGEKGPSQMWGAGAGVWPALARGEAC